MNDELSPVEEIMLQMWREHYPFLYWANRINKINPLNPHDDLEAIFTLLQLADTYVTNLVAMLLNPNEPWYFVKERAYEGQIKEILGLFRESENDRIDIRNYDPGKGGIISLTPREGWEASTTKDKWDVRPLDVLVSHLLGCPATEDKEEARLEFQEDPEHYIEVCNGVINFRQNWKHLLNDMKHGFRLLPFKWESIEDLEHITVSSSPGFDLDEKKEEYEDTKDDYVYFWRLYGRADQIVEHDEGVPEGYASGGFGLLIYRIDIGVCKSLSGTINLLLYNLISSGQAKIVERIEPLVDESGRVNTFEEFIPITMLTKD